MKKSTKIIALIVCIMTVLTSLPLSMMLVARELPTYTLEASRLDEEAEETIVYTGTVSATVDEEDAYYTFPIYRDGDLSESSSVALKSIDISAVYGKDYEFVADDVLVESDGVCLLEKNHDSTQTVSIDDAEATESDDVVSINTDEVDLDNEEATLAESILAEYSDISEYAVDYAAAIIVYFEPQQSEAQVKLRIFDDSKSEGEEAVTFMLCDAEGATVVEPNLFSLVLEDNDKQETSVISFSDAEFTSKEGVATATIKREDAIYSMASFTIKTCYDTAKAGVNYTEMYETVAFSPYETEKTFDFKVAGEGRFELILDEFQACEGGDYTRAWVNIAEDSEEELVDAEESSFSICVNGHDYRVEYTGSEPTEGKIMDDTATPAICVGRYIFAHPDTFNYSTDNWRQSEPTHIVFRYNSGPKVGDKNIYFEYYKFWATKEGESYVYSRKKMVNTLFYSSLYPVWASDSGFGSKSPQFRFRLTGENHSFALEGSIDGKGSFGKRFDNDAKIVLGKRHLDNYYIEMIAGDFSNKIVKSYMSFYGVVAFYRSFRVEIAAADTLQYRTKQGGTISVVPAQAYSRSGRKLVDEKGPHSVYANTNENETNIVVTTEDSSVNGRSGKFGTIAGYDIVINPMGKIEGKSVAKTLKYPEGFKTWLTTTGKTAGNQDIGYNDSTKINNELKKLENLDTIPYDAFFVDWIYYTMGDDYLDYTRGNEKYVELQFKPKFEYYKVEVEVLDPTVAHGKFKSSELTKGTHYFNYGDELNMEILCDEGYKIEGYQVSTDKINWSTITVTQGLFMQKGVKYYVRPMISKKLNAIEIQFENGAENIFSVQNMLDKTQTSSVADLSGKNVLIANPKETDIDKKAKVTAGVNYLVNIVVDKTPDDKNYVYRPIVKTPLSKTAYNAQMIPIIASDEPADNIVRIGYEKVLKSSLSERNLTGLVLRKSVPIRDTALKEKEVAVSGYSVFAGTSQIENDGKYYINSINGLTDADGKYTLEKVVSKGGDVIPMLITNGTTQYEIVTVTVDGSAKEQASQKHIISYPYAAPTIQSISYEYGDEEHTRKEGTTKNSINIYDDDLILTFNVDKKGRKISYVRVDIVTVTGKVQHLNAVEEENNPGIFKVRIKKMVDNVYSGDRIYAKIFDADKGQIVVNDEKKDFVISYPEIETGLLFFLENQPIVPQDYSFTDTPSVNIPLVGTTSATATSGLINWDRIDWEKDPTTGKLTGYTISINIGLGYNSMVDKYNWFKDFKNTVNKANKQRQGLYPDENALRSEQLIYRFLTMKKDVDDPILWKNLVNEKAANIESLSKKDPQAAKNTMAEMDKFNWKVDLTILAGLNFIYNPTKNAYQYACGAVSVGVTADCDYTKYITVSAIPAYLNVGGTFQIDCMVDYVTKKGSDAFTAGDFKKYTGNITEILRSKEDKVNLTLLLGGRIGLGGGYNGVLGGKGSLSLNLQFLINAKGEGADGLLVDFGGTITFDAIITSFSIKILRVNYGKGAYKDQTKFDFFGGLKRLNDSELPDEAYNLNEDDTFIRANETEVYSLHSYLSGTADMSNFGNYEHQKDENGDVEVAALLENASETARAQIIQIGKNEYFLVFIGNRGGNSSDENSFALYYSVYKDEHWSAPKLVDDDATFDSLPNLYCDDGKVYIGYVDSSKEFTDENEIEMLGCLKCEMAVYDIEGDTITDIVQFSSGDDNKLEFSPDICSDGDSLYAFYHWISTDGVTDIEDLFDPEKCEVNFEYTEISKQNYSVSDGVDLINRPEGTNTVYTDNLGSVAKINGTNYLFAILNENREGDVSSSSDNNLYLYLKDLDHGVEFKPVKISEEGVGASSPKLTTVGENLFLTYLGNGSKMKLVNLSNIFGDLFSDGKDEIYRADAQNDNWYVKSAEELGVERELYEGSVWERFGQGKVSTVEKNLNINEKGNTTYSDYQVVSNGKNLYFFFTDNTPNKETETSNIRDIFGCCYYIDDESNWGFTNTVQHTDCNKNISNISCVVDGDEIVVVGDMNEEYIDPETCDLIVTPNALTEFRFKISPQPKAENVEFSFNGYEQAVINFDIQNKGLGDASSFSYTVEFEKDGEKTEIYSASQEKTGTLAPYATVSDFCYWNVPEDISNSQIVITVTTNENKIYKFTEPVPEFVNVEFEEVESSLFDGTLTVTGKVKNNGNIPSESFDVSLYKTNDAGEHLKTYDSLSIATLDKGGYEEFEINVPVTKDDFNESSYIPLLLTNSDGNEEDNAQKFEAVATEPKLAEINNGEETLTLKHGVNSQLETIAYPNDNIDREIYYYSTDNAVASVDSNGNIHANGIGSATVYAYYPSLGIGDCIDVEVVVPFIDVQKGEWFYDGVTQMYKNGYMYGTSNTTFEPYAEMTRGMFAAVLYRMDGATATASVTPFTDVNPSSYYADAVIWAYSKGIVSGVSETEFKPDNPITREQAAAMLKNYCTYKGLTYEDTGKDIFDYADYFDISKWAENAMNYSVKYGLLYGNDYNKLLPQKVLTRAEGACLLERVK